MNRKLVAMVVALCGFCALGAGAAAAVGSSGRSIAHASSTNPYSECGSAYAEGCQKPPTNRQLNDRNRREMRRNASYALRANFFNLSHGSIVLRATAASAGTLVIDLYATVDGVKVLVAVTKHNFGRLGRPLGTVRLRFTALGQKLLHAEATLGKFKKVKLRITVQLRFFPKSRALRRWQVIESKVIKA